MRCCLKVEQSVEVRYYELHYDSYWFIMERFGMELALKLIQATSLISKPASFSLLVHVVIWKSQTPWKDMLWMASTTSDKKEILRCAVPSLSPAF